MRGREQPASSARLARALVRPSVHASPFCEYAKQRTRRDPALGQAEATLFSGGSLPRPPARHPESRSRALKKRQLTVARSDGRGHVSAPKAWADSERPPHGTSGDRASCSASPARPARFLRCRGQAAHRKGRAGHRSSRRAASEGQAGRSHPAPHVLFASRHARCASTSDSGFGWAQDLRTDAALHAPESGSGRIGDSFARMGKPGRAVAEMLEAGTGR
jgi:hypothetical protein